MTEREQQATEGTRRQGDLMARLVPDPSNVPDVKALVGWLGDSTREGHVRLYLSPDLDEYLDVPEEAVRHREDTGDQGSTLGATAIWVQRSATLHHTRTVSRQAEADFLQGAITTAYLRGARQGSLLGADALARLRVGDTDVTVCKTCPHSDFAPVCTLATSCWTTVKTDPGCGGKVFAF